jgi:hypothetical protein
MADVLVTDKGTESARSRNVGIPYDDNSKAVSLHAMEALGGEEI